VRTCAYGRVSAAQPPGHDKIGCVVCHFICTFLPKREPSRGTADNACIAVHQPCGQDLFADWAICTYDWKKSYPLKITIRRHPMKISKTAMPSRHGSMTEHVILRAIHSPHKSNRVLFENHLSPSSSLVLVTVSSRPDT
jgi:hypothetical protein